VRKLIKCPHCSKEVNEDAFKCPNCDELLIDSSINEASPNREEDLRFLIQLSSNKLDKVDKELGRNWIYQVIIVAISVAIIFNIGKTPSALKLYLFKSEEIDSPFYIAIPLVLLYLFMRFGHLLGTFVKTHKMHDSLLDEYNKRIKVKNNVMSLYSTTNFFELYYRGKGTSSPGRIVIFSFLIFTMLILSFNHASSIFFLSLALNYSKWLVIPIYSIIIFFLYRQFYISIEDIQYSRRMVIIIIIVSIMFALILLIMK